ncbi:MAG: DEAD/DEAH box helicase family protein [Bacteroidaceae bacterium]|nr:DEAD/DEAH box helicase family protein [Bacteroidaceae bacterium]
MELRPYQLDLFQKTQSAFLQGYRRPVVVAPCGAGKSYLFAEMVRKTRGEALVLTHREELKEQHERLFRNLGIENVRVAMILTEANRLGQYPTPALIVADEAHLSRSNSWMKVIRHYDTWTVGMTATPVRLDGKPLGDVFDTMVEGVDVKWLIDHRNLAPYEYYAPTAIETDGLRMVAGDYVVSDLEKLMNERAIYGDVITSYRKFAPGERSIAYCVSVEHARATADAFNSAGIRAEYLSAGTAAGRRKQIMDDFRTGVITVLCNVGIISEGVSIDEVTCCMLLRPTESVALGIQQMMRCMRYLPGKTAKIIDFVGNYTRVGLPDENRVWSLGEPLKRKPNTDGNGDFYIRSCPECYMTFKTAPVCPFCGAEYPLHPREIKAHEEIELKRITAEEMARVEAEKKKARLEQGRAQTFEELVAIGKAKGYKNPAFWASQVLRGRRR